MTILSKRSPNSAGGPYLQALLRAYRTEVFGESAYAVMAGLALRSSHREKLDLLRRLEAQTGARLRAVFARSGLEVDDDPLTKLLGGVAVATLVLPWRWQMRVLAAIGERTVLAFERFERQFGDRDPGLARHLLAHERAQLDFFRRELADDERSLEAVHALLE